VLWVEARSGLGPDECFGKHEFVRKNVDRADVVARTGADAVMKAPRLPIVVIGALECKVMCPDAPLGIRVVAWSRLVKVYGTLRWDDLQRLRPCDTVLRQAGLVGRLSQTKTSGAGKKVRDLPLFIPRHAYVLEGTWLETGYALWARVGDRDRDYFLPRFTRDLSDTYSVPASSNDLAILGRITFEALKVPIGTAAAEGVVGWREGTVPLIPGPLLGGWTGHSERCTLPSIFAAMGVPKSERDPLGRWSPSGSDDYVRTYRALINNLAHKFRAMLACGNVLCATDEEEAIDEVRVYAARLGNIDADILQESAHSMVTTARIFYGLWSMDPAVTPAQVPTVQGEPSVDQDKGLAENAKYLIVLSKKGAMLRLHLAAGCWKAQTRTFASYELCELDPVPKNLYSHYYHACWPREAPRSAEAGDEEDEMSDSEADTSSASEGSEA
jgi:hypothetical protein